MSGWMKVMRDAAWLTQLGISVLTPPILCTALAYWATERYAISYWAIIVGLLLGLGGSAASLIGFYRHTLRKAKKSAKDTPPAFNQHH